MYYFILQIILFIVFIILVHYLWNVCKDTFTVKKTKDLNTTIEKYKLLIETNFNNSNSNSDLDKVNVEDTNENELIENDLNQFINELQINEEK
jgi:hypothetical protein